MTIEDPVTGGCLCGEIRYRITGPRNGGFLCHCRMCQRASGAAFAALFYVSDASLSLSRGRLRSYKSSAMAERHFCEACGSPIFLRRLNRPGECGVFVGSLDDPNDFQPEISICQASAVGWTRRLDDLPRYDAKPAEMAPPLDYDPVTGRAT